MNCSKCGMPYPEGRLFCTNCGNKLAGEQNSTAPAMNAVQSNTTNPSHTAPPYFAAAPVQQSMPQSEPGYPNQAYPNPAYANIPTHPKKPSWFDKFKVSFKDGSLWLKIARIAVYALGALILIIPAISVLTAWMPLGIKLVVFLVTLLVSFIAAVISMTFSMIFINQAENVQTMTKQNDLIIKLLQKEK